MLLLLFALVFNCGCVLCTFVPPEFDDPKWEAIMPKIILFIFSHFFQIIIFTTNYQRPMVLKLKLGATYLDRFQSYRIVNGDHAIPHAVGEVAVDKILDHYRFYLFLDLRGALSDVHDKADHHHVLSDHLAR